MKQTNFRLKKGLQCPDKQTEDLEYYKNNAMTNLQKIPKKANTKRFVIVPIKKHLAKFLLFDNWSIIEHPDPVYQYSFEFWLIYTLRFEPDFLKIRTFYLECLIGEHLYKNERPTYKYYRKRPTEFKKYYDNKYTLLKIEFNVSTIKYKKHKLNKESIYRDINQYLEYQFRQLLYIYTNGEISKKLIEKFLNMLNINQSEIKTDTLTRYFERKKQKKLWEFCPYQAQAKILYNSILENIKITKIT